MNILETLPRFEAPRNNSESLYKKKNTTELSILFTFYTYAII